MTRSRLTNRALVAVSLALATALTARAEVNTVRMKIDGYLCGN